MKAVMNALCVNELIFIPAIDFARDASAAEPRFQFQALRSDRTSIAFVYRLLAGLSMVYCSNTAGGIPDCGRPLGATP